MIDILCGVESGGDVESLETAPRETDEKRAELYGGGGPWGTRTARVEAATSGR